MSKTIWQIWDEQTNDKKDAQDAAFVELNNTYLAVERGTKKLTVGLLNTLWVLVEKVYPLYGMKMGSFEFLMQKELIAHWYTEIEKLPNWINC